MQHTFEIDVVRSCLLGGMDDIDLTRQHANDVRRHEARHRAR
jgi:3-isopropylmalate dehydratase small subunit